MNRVRTWLLLATLTITQHALSAETVEEFSFDIDAYQKKNYLFSGYAELRTDQQALNQNSAAYQLGFIGQPNRDTLNQHTAAALLNGSYLRNHWEFTFSGHGTAQQDELANQRSFGFYEAYAAYKPAPDRTYEIGKRTLKWGKGYAWNPVGFVERPKNPDEPDLARDGYVMATTDLITSYPGKLSTLAVTPVYLPVRTDINSDYGKPGHDNLAAKLYLLYGDTDIDLVYLNSGSRSQRFGLDFARNLRTNFEIHGEWAYLTDFTRTIVDSGGTVSTGITSGHQFLAGLRYLTQNETTIIAEYYHNQTGYSPIQMQDFYTAVHNADATSNTALLTQLASLSPMTYLKRTPGQNYFYLRLSNKEPFDRLYYTLAVNLITNLDDRSYSVTPELIYTGLKNYELRFRASWLQGGLLTEFEEKRNQRKIEFRLRYYY